jgi:uncharacterized protein YegP (UPF0339 family)
MGKFEVFISEENNQYYFHLKADNGEIIFASEGYTEKSNALNGIDSIKRNVTNREMLRIIESKDKKYYFNLVATNGEIIGTSETYNTLSNMNEGFERVEKYAPSAPIVDLTV